MSSSVFTEDGVERQPDSPSKPKKDAVPFNYKVRHGFDAISENMMVQLAEGYFTYFADKRHETQGRMQPDVGSGDWRVADRQRTVNAALVMCLNLGVDPPDVVKTQPAARLEAWVDPQQYGDSKKALEQIGKNLQTQYESLSARTKFKQSLDPVIDDIKRFCQGLRRSARDDRILFHYNGHGVPLPTASGEIWMFNRGYTQYIPLSVYELQTWLGAPVIYCYDCSAAGNIVRSFDEFVEKRKELQIEDNAVPVSLDASSGPMSVSPGSSNTPLSASGSVNVGGSTGTSSYAYDSCIQLGACRADEILPMNPNLPADLFTCCITTPVDIAVKWFLIQNAHGFASSGLDPATVKIPGKITDRRTPLGELNWIFTAITDTIAWSVLDSKLFKRLFRQDLIVAAMLRNFLLACRIMRAHNCHPVSSPALPDTCKHPLWDSWDAAVNHCLLQVASTSPQYEGHLFSDFFEQQLTAFELWLNYQSGDVEKPPEQLPILLQVLLSQIHRLRALSLLCRYLDLGPQAVRIALSIGFFIYVLKLLQSPAPELQPVLVFIWTRTLAVDRSSVDRSVQTDLMKEESYMYFVRILTSPSRSEVDTSSSIFRSKKGDAAMCCFVLAQFAHDYANSKSVLVANEQLLTVLETNLEAESPLLRQWSILLLSELTPSRSLPKMLWRLKDPIPEVRAAILYALTAFLRNGHLSDGDTEMIGRATVSITLDGSPLVRYELVVFLSHFIARNVSKFVICAFTTLEEEFAASKYGGDLRSQSPAHGTVSLALWRCLLVLTDDAMPHIRKAADLLVDNIQSKLVRTPLSDEVRQMVGVLLEPGHLRNANRAAVADQGTQGIINAIASVQQTTPFSHLNLNDTEPDTRNGQNPQSLLKSAVNWIIGVEPDIQAGPPAKSQSVKMRSSLASMNTRLHTPPPDETGFNRSSTSPNKQIPSQFHSPSGNGFHGSGASSTERHQIPANNYSSSSITMPKSRPIRLIFSPNSHREDGVSSSAFPSNEVITEIGKYGNSLELGSEFRDFCVDYFREPQLKPNDTDEPGSKKYYERMWRKSRNEKIMADTQVQKTLAVRGVWSNQVARLEGANNDPAKKLLFAQFEPQLLSASSSSVAVFDWHRGELLNKFNAGRDLTEMKLLNEDDVPLLLTSSRDGIARVFKNYESPDDCNIITSWWLFADLAHHHPQSPSVYIDWQQSRGHLLVGGDARVIRAWDVAREQAIGDMPVRTSAQLSALTSDKVEGNLVLAGFIDGAIHVYDRRMDKPNSLVRRWKLQAPSSNGHILGHNSRILNLQMQRGGTREVVSGSTDGQICLWDIRNSSAVGGFRAHTKEMRYMDLHEHAPIIATASRITGVWSTSGRRIATLKGSTHSYLSSRVSPLGSLSFHPHQMVLATGDLEDASISVFRCIP